MNDRELHELLEAMVRIPSPSGEESEIAAMLADLLPGLGFEAHVDRAGNLVASIGEGPEEGVLLGHIDTVPGDLEVRRDGDVLWGRGTVDAKGPFAAFIAAAARAAPALDGLRLVLIGCVEEEAPSSRGARFAVGRPPPRFCIVGEPSGWDGVTLGYKGSLTARLEVDVPRAHGAHAGSSAAELACGVWSAVCRDAETFNAGRERLFDLIMPRLVSLEAGPGGDGRDRASAALQWRLPEDVGPEELRARVSGATAGADGVGFAFDEGIPAWSGPRTTPLHRRLLGAIRSRGGRARCLRKTGTADLNIVAPAWDCPALAYGPGDSALDHRPDEHVDLREVSRSAEILTEVLAGIGAALPGTVG